MKIVGLAGFSGSGKDTAFANLPLEGWQRWAFADPLKEDIRKLPGLVGLDLADPNVKEKVRPLLVAYGAVMRALYPDYWILRTMRHIENGGRPAILTDCRYANELMEVFGWGGLVIRIVRPGVGPKNDEEARSFAEIDSAHLAIPVVLNDSTPEDLGRRVAWHIERHFNG